MVKRKAKNFMVNGDIAFSGRLNRKILSRTEVKPVSASQETVPPFPEILINQISSTLLDDSEIDNTGVSVVQEEVLIDIGSELLQVLAPQEEIVDDPAAEFKPRKKRRTNKSSV